MFNLNRRHLSFRTLKVLAVAAAAAACRDGLIEPTGPKVSVCHREGTSAAVTEIYLSALAGHQAHGDYVARLEVDKVSTPGDSIHFTRLTDALAAARAGRIARNEVESAGCRITIVVAPGTLNGSTKVSSDPLFERFPLVIDVPDITLQGALKMQVDAAGRATGVGESMDVTTFAPDQPLVLGTGSTQTASPEKLIVINGHPDGPKGHGAIIEGFAFRSGRATSDTITGGHGIYAMRVRDVVLRGNRFEGGLNSAMDLQASSVIVERNHLSGRGSSCDICLAGPGNYIARDNRILDGGIPGVLVFPAVSLPAPSMVEPYTLPATSLVTALVTNNEVRGHTRKPVGVGLRVGAIGIGASSVAGTAKVTFSGNNLVGNTFGILIEGGFVGGTRRGDIEVITSGNTISQSCQHDVLVSLAPSQTGLGIGSVAYLLNSTYKIAFGADIQWDNVWFANAAGFGNTLIVNGETIPNGSRVAYDAARVCP